MIIKQKNIWKNEIIFDSYVLSIEALNYQTTIFQWRALDVGYCDINWWFGFYSLTILLRLFRFI